MISVFLSLPMRPHFANLMIMYVCFNFSAAAAAAAAVVIVVVNSPATFWSG